MNVTLTTADMLVSLVIGIAGSVAAAHLYKWLALLTSANDPRCEERSAMPTENNAGDPP